MSQPNGEWDYNFYGVRDAIHRSTDGQSGRYIYGKAQKDGREFRITNYRNRRGLHYGYELNTGQWVVLGGWSER